MFKSFDLNKNVDKTIDLSVHGLGRLMTVCNILTLPLKD